MGMRRSLQLLSSLSLLLLPHLAILLPSAQVLAFKTATFPILQPQRRHQHKHHLPSSPSSCSSSFSASASSSTALMGIRGFRGWFESQFGSSMTKLSSDDSDTFDHVLIDVNPLLHVCLRKSRSDGHGLTLLLKELDAILRQIQPTQSLVLALDGPPSASKLAMQRKRRMQVLSSVQRKTQQLETVGSKRFTAKTIARKKRAHLSETRTLSITPGTDFMKLAEQAILYWAWQRLDSRNGILAGANNGNGVKVFLSPSTVPGEGEVKLLEWIYKKPRRGESIAILSGDSDLVLEALLIPLQSTPNVFVIWPAVSSQGHNKHYVCVGLFETTRRLQNIVPRVSVENLMNLRTDIVLLLLLNGNDYLPKLRGSAGFNRLFRHYVRLQQEFEKGEPVFLVDPDSLEFNLDVCINFFQRLVAATPTQFHRDASSTTAANTSQGQAVQQLQQYVDSGYLPKPLCYQVMQLSRDAVVNGDTGNKQDGDIASGLDDSEEEEDDELVDREGEEEEGGDGDKVDDILVQLRLGTPGSDDYYVYETWHPRNLPQRIARRKLARMALVDLLDFDDDDFRDDDQLPGSSATTTGYYEWEIRHPVEEKVDSYLYGLLWNLQSYQDGICADYAYNYGKRRSPSAKDIVEFFKQARQGNQKVGLRQLQKGPFSPPVNAGVACLAALPIGAKHFAPEPYCWLADETVEELYGACMNKYDNTFDALMFEHLCNEHVAGLPTVSGRKIPTNGGNLDEEDHGRGIWMSDHLWNVVSKVGTPLRHPFDPPLPFSDKLSKLRPNNRIRVSKILAIQEPRPRAVWGDRVVPPSEQHAKRFAVKDTRELNHSGPAPFMMNLESLDELELKQAYPKQQRQEQRQDNKKKTRKGTGVQKEPLVKQTGARKDPLAQQTSAQKKPLPTDGAKKQVSVKQSSSLEAVASRDGQSALACLKQLHDRGLVGPIIWQEIDRSPNLELVRLIVRRGRNQKQSVLQEDLTFDQLREVHGLSRKALKQHLASLALCEITGLSREWSELSFSELKHHLQSRLCP